MARAPAVVILAFALVGCGWFGDGDQALTELPVDPAPISSQDRVATPADIGNDVAPLVVTSPAAGSETTAESTASTTSTTQQSGGLSSQSSSSTTANAPSSSAATSTSQPSTNPTTTGSTTSLPSVGGACRASATACVGPGQQFATLSAAVAAAGNGAIIELAVGRYNETVAVAADNVTVRSVPRGRATVDCSGLRPARGKACILAVGTNLTVEDMVVTGARGPDDNEACFRNEPGTRYTVRRVECFGSNNGILGSGGSWLIEDSHFHDNGAGDGFSHNLYLSGDCSDVVFRRSTSERAVGGHAFKSRCRTSTIEGSTLRDNTVADAAEFSYGGAVTITNTVIHQPDGPNGNIVRHGAEGCRHPGRLSFVNATISSGRSQGYIRSECGTVGFSATALQPGITVTQP